MFSLILNRRTSKGYYPKRTSPGTKINAPPSIKNHMAVKGWSVRHKDSIETYWKFTLVQQSRVSLPCADCHRSTHARIANPIAPKTRVRRTELCAILVAAPVNGVTPVPVGDGGAALPEGAAAPAPSLGAASEGAGAVGVGPATSPTVEPAVWKAT